nr:MAG TPA: replication initiator protein [Caudoviricetes sp.]
MSALSKILYSWMLDRYYLSLANREKWTDEDGDVFIYFSRESVAELLDCSLKTATKLFKEIEDANLIYIVEQRGMKPNRIYVFDLLGGDGRDGEEGEEDSQAEELSHKANVENYTSRKIYTSGTIENYTSGKIYPSDPDCGVNHSSTEGKILPPNKTEKNNTYIYNNTKYIEGNDPSSLSAGNNKIEEDNSNLYNSDYVEDYDSQTEYSPSPTPSHIDARRNYLERTKNVMPPPEYFEQFKTKPDVTTRDEPSGDAPADEPPIKEEPAYLANMRLALKHREEELAAKAPDPTKSGMQIAHEKQMADQAELEAALAECDWYPEDDE